MATRARSKGTRARKVSASAQRRSSSRRSVELRLTYPRRSSRLLNGLFLKYLLVFPHYVVLGVMAIGVAFTTALAWLAIIATGRYPRRLWEFSASYWRYQISITAYVMLLTDEYPRFPWN